MGQVYPIFAKKVKFRGKWILIKSLGPFSHMPKCLFSEGAHHNEG